MAHYSHSPTLRRQRYGCLVVGVLALLGLPGLIIATSEKPFLEALSSIWPLMLGPALIVVFIIPYMRWKVQKTARKMAIEGKNDGYYGPCTVSIDSDGVRESKSTDDTSRRWPAVEKVLVTETHALIFTSGVEAFLVPRRAFETEDKFQDFVDDVSRNAGVVHQTV